MCCKAGLFPPPWSPRSNVRESMWHTLSETHTLIIICIDSKQTWAFDQTCTHTQPHKIGTWGPMAPTPSLAFLMRTGPCAFDPAASPQPRGPSASCLFNNPYSLSSYSPIASGRVWIQSKSTSGQLFDIKASLTGIARDKEKKQKSNTIVQEQLRICTLIGSFCLVRHSSKMFSIDCFKWQLIAFTDC